LTDKSAGPAPAALAASASEIPHGKEGEEIETKPLSEISLERDQKKQTMVNALKNWLSRVGSGSKIEERLAKAEEMLKRAKTLDETEKEKSEKKLDQKMGEIEGEVQLQVFNE
jgi:hypothetical protein